MHPVDIVIIGIRGGSNPALGCDHVGFWQRVESYADIGCIPLPAKIVAVEYIQPGASQGYGCIKKEMVGRDQGEINWVCFI
jgi:hypothetical protein